jgi:cell wall-associated NlpC family hydrolase
MAQAMNSWVCRAISSPNPTAYLGGAEEIMTNNEQRGKHLKKLSRLEKFTNFTRSVAHRGIVKRVAGVVALAGLSFTFAVPSLAADLPTGTGELATSAKGLVESESIATVAPDAQWGSDDSLAITVIPTPARTTSAAARTTSRDVGDLTTFDPSTSPVLQVAAQYLGVPYVYGGSTPAGFDCSGFTQYVFKQLGYSIPRTAGAQVRAGRIVSAEEARPGDLFVKSDGSHVVIYAGGGMMVHSPRTGRVVSYQAMYTWNGTFVRVIE